MYILTAKYLVMSWIIADLDQIHHAKYQRYVLRFQSVHFQQSWQKVFAMAYVMLYLRDWWVLK